VALRIGECHIGQGHFAEALKSLFKAYYLQPEDNRVLRAIAWCYLQENDASKAENYYAKLLANTPQPDDYINAGHTAWIDGRIGEAVLRYKTYLAKSHYKGLIDDIFRDDEDLLHAHGIADDDVRLMSDILKTANTASAELQ